MNRNINCRRIARLFESALLAWNVPRLYVSVDIHGKQIDVEYAKGLWLTSWEVPDDTFSRLGTVTTVNQLVDILILFDWVVDLDNGTATDPITLHEAIACVHQELQELEV